MAASPDTLLFTGYNLQQVSAGAALVTPTSGTQDNLADLLGDANTMNATYFFTGTPAATTPVFFIATRAMIITAAYQVHSTAAGGTSTLDIVKDTGTSAPAAGTAVLSAAFNLNATANTVQVGALSATTATITLAAGDRLSVKFNNAIQSSAGVVVTVKLAAV
jgi:hypothetical protein